LSSGIVKWFDERKGYGFIVPDEGSEDLFVHHTNILVEGYRTLKEGQRVNYEKGQGRKGPEATNVKPC
jgi:CspA family cold shock protein